MSFLDLPNEIILQIARNQDLPDTNALLRTNQRLARLLTHALIDNAFLTNTNLRRYGKSVLFSAAGRQDNVTVKRLLDSGVLDGGEIFATAVSSKSEATVRTLIGCGVDTTAKRNGRTPLYDAISRGSEKIVRLLLRDKRTQLNQSYPPSPPLHLAVYLADKAVTQLLLAEERLDVNIRGRFNNTPLHEAICRSKDRSHILSMLLADKRVDPNLKNQSGLTPFHEAVKLGCEATVRIFLTSDAVDINAKDPAGETPVHRAISLGWRGMLPLLVKDTRFKINEPDRYRRTPLYLAASLDQMHTVRLLLDHREADVNASSLSGETPLHVAANKGHERVVRLLLERDDLDIDYSPPGRSSVRSLARNYSPTIRKLVLGYGSSGQQGVGEASVSGGEVTEGRTGRRNRWGYT